MRGSCCSGSTRALTHPSCIKHAPCCMQAPYMDSVLKVYCVHTEPNHSMPWQRKRSYPSSSTGFVAAGGDRRWILTNAHSVQSHTQVRRPSASLHPGARGPLGCSSWAAAQPALLCSRRQEVAADLQREPRQVANWCHLLPRSALLICRSRSSGAATTANSLRACCQLASTATSRC